MRNFEVLICLVALVLINSGCAEGPLWKTGSYVPWAREQWEAEERLANTLFERKRKLNELVESVADSGADAQSKVAEKLGEIVQRDSVLLLRLHAVALLGKLDGPATRKALQQASRDADSRVRIAAIRAWESMSPEVAVPQLQEMLGNDTDIDVRLAATRALGRFSGNQAIDALSLALTDSNPAIQYRATESLEKITGEKIGADVGAWQSFIASRSGNRTADGESGASSPTSVR